MMQESNFYKTQELKLKSWTLNVEEDTKTGDYMLTFPPELLEQAGWKEGDTLDWIDQKDGSWLLKKVDKTSEKSV
jgi:bifunctional DNA-binding transcriptional regulator/antitoxin component of YhaV-PrlF toxin-antitoxin module